MTQEEFILHAKHNISKYKNTDFDNINVVWYNYTAGNQKALFMIPESDVYFEFTYINSDNELVFDVYNLTTSCSYKVG